MKARFHLIEISKPTRRAKDGRSLHVATFPGRFDSTHGIAVWLAAALGVAVFTPTVSIAATNYFPQLTVGDRTFTNVTLGTLTAADVVLWYEGGGARVALSNLPPELQSRLNYDPELAAELLAKRARQRAAYREQQAAVAADVAAQGRPRTLRVIEVDTSAGTPLCVTDVGEIWIQNLPQATITRLAERQDLEQRIRHLNAQILENTRALRFEEAMAPELPGAPEWFVEGLKAQRTREIRLRNTVTEQQSALAQLSQMHQNLLPEADRVTRIIASKSTRKYRGHDVWRSLGIAPPPEEQQEDPGEQSTEALQPGTAQQ